MTLQELVLLHPLLVTQSIAQHGLFARWGHCSRVFVLDAVLHSVGLVKSAVVHVGICQLDMLPAAVNPRDDYAYAATRLVHILAVCCSLQCMLGSMSLSAAVLSWPQLQKQCSGHSGSYTGRMCE